MLPVACLIQWCFPPGIMNIIAAIMAVQASAYTMDPEPSTPVRMSTPTMTSMGTQHTIISS